VSRDQNHLKMIENFGEPGGVRVEEFERLVVRIVHILQKKKTKCMVGKEK